MELLKNIELINNEELKLSNTIIENPYIIENPTLYRTSPNDKIIPVKFLPVVTKVQNSKNKEMIINTRKVKKEEPKEKENEKSASSFGITIDYQITTGGTLTTTKSKTEANALLPQTYEEVLENEEKFKKTTKKGYKAAELKQIMLNLQIGTVSGNKKEDLQRTILEKTYAHLQKKRPQ